MPAQEDRASLIFSSRVILFFVGVFLVIALLNRQRDLVILTVLILGIMISTRVWSKLSLSNIIIRSHVDKYKVFPDERLYLHLSAENKKWLPVQLKVDVPFDHSLQSSHKEMVLQNECGLLWYQKVDFQWELVARKRGIYQVGPPSITAGDFFGFYVSHIKKERASTHVIVYPRVIPLKPFDFPRKDFFGIPGAKSPVQDPIYILGTRDYQHWQPARYIHWKASARHNRLQEKVFEPSSLEKILILLNVAPFAENNEFEAFERTLEAVASLAVQCDQKGYAMGFLTNGIVRGAPAYLSISRGPQQLFTILEILARLSMKSKGPLLDELSNGFSFPWGISSVCFSFAVDASLQPIERFFSHRKIPIQFISCGKEPASQQEMPMGYSKVMTLDEICIKEKRP